MTKRKGAEMPCTIKVKWDTSDGDWNPLPGDIGLPELVTLPPGIEEEDISDWLSDKWGYCHFGWSYHSGDQNNAHSNKQGEKV